jgi:ethanolamine-phosphate cytidylyltransferase
LIHSGVNLLILTGKISDGKAETVEIFVVLPMASNESVRVWANGCFDVFHFGHANFLRQAKVMGDYLIAGVHGDLDIAKNKAHPVMGENERAKIISAVKWVDEVQTGIPYGDVLKTLNEHACEFCVHGDDIAQDASGCDIYSECKENGMFRECKRTEGISTTSIIDRILLGNAGGHALGWNKPEVDTQWPHAPSLSCVSRSIYSLSLSLPSLI